MVSDADGCVGRGKAISGNAVSSSKCGSDADTIALFGWIYLSNSAREQRAAFLTSAPFRATVNTSEATLASTDPECGVATVWYRFRPRVSGILRGQHPGE